MNNRKMVIIRDAPWKSPFPLSTYHYARFFLDNNWRILWLSAPLNPFSFFYRMSKEKIQLLKLWIKKGEIYCNGKLLTCSFFCLFPLNKKLHIFDNMLIARYRFIFSIPSPHSYFTLKGFDKPDVLWISDINQYGILRFLNPKVLIFHMVDDYFYLPDASRISNRIVDELLKLADITFFSSANLLRRIKKTHPSDDLSSKFYWLPNGVDLEKFTGTYKEPWEYKAIPHPRITYVGALAEWLDWELIYKMAIKFKSFSLIFVGQQRTKSSIPREIKEKLSKLQNVYFLGPRKHVEVPAYLKWADAAIAPFKMGHLYNSINPIKIYEYLACGLPVVAMYSEELDIIKAPIFLAKTEEEFLRYLVKAVNSGRKNRTNYIDFARNNTWGSRFKYIKYEIELRLKD